MKGYHFYTKGPKPLAGFEYKKDRVMAFTEAVEARGPNEWLTGSILWDSIL